MSECIEVVRVTVPSQPRVIRVAPVIGTSSGGGGSIPVRIDQIAPAGTWILTHALGRMPLADVYLSSGEQMEADVNVTLTQVTVTFAAPQSGFVIIY
jgi:hypothetical protein